MKIIDGRLVPRAPLFSSIRVGLLTASSPWTWAARSPSSPLRAPRLQEPHGNTSAPRSLARAAPGCPAEAPVAFHALHAPESMRLSYRCRSSASVASTYELGSDAGNSRPDCRRRAIRQRLQVGGRRRTAARRPLSARGLDARDGRFEPIPLAERRCASDSDGSPEYWGRYRSLWLCSQPNCNPVICPQYNVRVKGSLRASAQCTQWVGTHTS